MKNFFDEFDIEEIKQRFSTDDACLSFLAEIKWSGGFVCKKCGNTNFCQGSTAYSRRCTRCKALESATAHTVFHSCKVPLPKAFQISWHVCHNPDIKLKELSAMMNIRMMTIWKIRKKLKACIDCNNGFLKTDLVEQS